MNLKQTVCVLVACAVALDGQISYHVESSSHPYVGESTVAKQHHVAIKELLNKVDGPKDKVSMTDNSKLNAHYYKSQDTKLPNSYFPEEIRKIPPDHKNGSTNTERKVTSSTKRSLKKLPSECLAAAIVGLDRTNSTLPEFPGFSQAQANRQRRVVMATVMGSKAVVKALKFFRKVKNSKTIVGGSKKLFQALQFRSDNKHNEFVEEALIDIQNNVNAINKQLSFMQEELKSHTEFTAWLTTYINWELDIYNGEEQLNKMIDLMVLASDDKERLKIAQDYVNYFEANDIEGKINNVFKVTAYPDKTKLRNLFTVYSTETNCNTYELALLFLNINNVAISAGKQIQVYYFLTVANPVWVDSHMDDFFGKMYGVRRQYEIEVWYCYQGTVNNAKITVEKILSTKTDLTGEALTRTLYETFIQQYPIYNWAVVQYEQIDNVKVCKTKIPSKGEQYFSVEAFGKKLLVVFKDVNETYYGCDVTELNTLITFEHCKDCSVYSVFASDTMLYEQQCEEVLLDEFKKIRQICNTVHSPYIVSDKSLLKQIKKDKYSFVAAGKQYSDPCQDENICHGQGDCKHIPFTPNHMCICYPYHDGDDCSSYQTLEIMSNITNITAELRVNFGNYNGIPDVIDVYFEVLDLANQLYLMQRDIQESIKFNRLISLYGSVFTDGEFIAISYNKLLSGEISEENFAEFIQDRDFPFIFNGLEILILGKGSLLSQDLLTSMKRVLLAENGPEFACTTTYADSISRLMTNLATFDQVITEAYIRLNKWKMETQNKKDQEQLLGHIQVIANAAMHRQKQYSLHWKDTSCGKLTDDEDIVEKYCDSKHSAEGMSVTLHCRNNKNLTNTVGSSVTCKKENGTLKWTSKPSCVYLWGSWGYWSSCSKSCGKGMQTRKRNKLNGETDTSTKDCYVEDCCTAEFQKFECSNRKCIPVSQLCDGKNDCGDLSDESKSRCSYLRVGDKIALRNNYWQRYMNGGSCSSSNCHHNLPDTSTCGGSSIYGSEWSSCSYQVFGPMVAFGRKSGEAIRYGDYVALKMGSHKSKDYWLRCTKSSDKCDGEDCKYFWSSNKSDWEKCKKEVFKIFALGREGTCGSNAISTCKGMPIETTDYVFLMYEYKKGYWLSHNDRSEVRLYPCLGTTFSKDKYNKCTYERWQLFVQ